MIPLKRYPAPFGRRGKAAEEALETHLSPEEVDFTTGFSLVNRTFCQFPYKIPEYYTLSPFRVSGPLPAAFQGDEDHFRSWVYSK